MSEPRKVALNLLPSGIMKLDAILGTPRLRDGATELAQAGLNDRDSQLPTPNFQRPTPNSQLPTSNFQLPTRVRRVARSPARVSGGLAVQKILDEL